MKQWFEHCWRESRLLGIGVLAITLAACGGSDAPKKETPAGSSPRDEALAVSAAEWDASGLELELDGTLGEPISANSNESISVTDADTKEVLTILPLSAGQNTFSLALDELSSVPCSITVRLGATERTIRVKNAPLGCAQLVDPGTLALTVRRAEWKNGRTLEVKGVADVPNTVTIRYAGTPNTQLAEVPVNDFLGRSLGTWKMKFSGFDAAKVPCALTVAAGDATQDVSVLNAPETCVGTPAPTPPPTPQPNVPPVGTLSNPAADVAIAVGGSVTFEGTGTDADNNVPLTYKWDFGGGAPASTVANPGAVTFATAGVYKVTFTVTDSLGLADPNPPSRVITVTAGNQPPVPVNRAPAGTIVSPAANVTIAPGQAITFDGSGTDADNNLPLTFAWSFGGAVADVTVEDPGSITFPTAGTFNVKFTVTDALGLSDPNPPVRIITVGSGGTVPPPTTPPPTGAAPTATITAPAADVEIVAGQSVTFAGTGTDPAGLAVTYTWHFAGGAPHSTVAEPGSITFKDTGIFPVRLHVKNSAGVSNATAVTRTITVTAPADAAKNVVVGQAREGLSTPDLDYSVMSVLPLNNTLRAQLVATNAKPTLLPQLIDNTASSISYKATADAANAITTTSDGKTTFWPSVNTQFAFVMPPNTTLLADEGLRGTVNPQSQSMPGAANTAQKFATFTAAAGVNLFEARAIPIVPLNDAKAVSNYPLFRLEATDSANVALAQLDVVAPVGNQMDCATGCHATGGVAADAAATQRLGGGITWSTQTDPANQAKENIWIIHATLHGLPAATTTNETCTRCHYTPLADPDAAGPKGTQQLALPSLSAAVHRLHGLAFGAAPPSATAPPVMADDKCGTCHESGGAKLNRGAMFSATLTCKDCHGGMLAVGGETELTTTPPRPRQPYVDQPRCESCHIGDAVTENGGTVVLRTAYVDTDLAATPRLEPTSRYAQEVGKGFVNSTGHGKLACPACHGVTHAEWPVDDPLANDNVTPTQLQGHRGVLTECKVCHVGGLDVTVLGGPHGLHAINDPAWVEQHGPVYVADPAVCRACHGLTLEGGYLSRAATARNFVKSDGTPITYTEGQIVGCADCHAIPQ